MKETLEIIKKGKKCRKFGTYKTIWGVGYRFKV